MEKLSSLAPVAIIICISAVIYLPAIFLVGNYAWDDGAITISYAQTLAAAGKFALTPESPIAEGTSSLLYTLLMAGFFKIMPLGFDGSVFLSQALTLAFVTGTSVALYFFLAEHLASRTVRLGISILYLLIPMNLAETLNGMEMAAFSLFLITYVELVKRRSLFTCIMVALIILTRFEAIFYLSLASAGTALFCGDPELRRKLLSDMAVAWAIFALLTLWRLYYFDQLVPNTIIAKTHEPYSAAGLRGLASKLAGGAEFIMVFSVLIAAIVTASSILGRAVIIRDYKFWLGLSFFVFSVITGRNWGYNGRMFLGVLPVLIILFASLLATLVSQSPGRLRLPAAGIGVAVVTALVTIANSSLARDNLQVIRSASAFSSAKQGGGGSESPYSYGWYGVTPENYRITGQSIQQIAHLADLEVIHAALPDVGGLGLCCENIAVHDLAFLTNPTLAREGYSFLDEYLNSVRPHLIETHGIWSHSSGIYESDFFRSGYKPVIFQNNFFWLRNDVYDSVVDRVGNSLKMVDPFEEPPIRYLSLGAGDVVDHAYLRSAGIASVARIDM